ncbi:MAG: tRNA (guanosine(37)-N1)-methyltransferase TrmD [Burkholderiaceae bacterium]
MTTEHAADAAPRFDVISLFPDSFAALTGFGITGRAFDRRLYALKAWNPRDFTRDAYKTVDDRPYGGGPGMLMMPEPLAATLAAIRAERGELVAAQAPLVFLTPHGPRLSQAAVRGMAALTTGAVLLCGRYEGVDQRFIDRYVDRTFCIGDFVVSGGELPTMLFLDAWVRLLPGALNDAASAVQESFENGRLDCPHYTRPEVFEEMRVPDVLLSGHHERIARWRQAQSEDFTARFRPDLLDPS